MGIARFTSFASSCSSLVLNRNRVNSVGTRGVSPSPHLRSFLETSKSLQEYGVLVSGL